MAGTFGSGLKTVQRGTVTLDANPDTVTITAVVLAKSFVIITSTPPTNDNTQDVTVTLTNTTTLTFKQTTTGASIVDWQVIEYY